MNNEQLLRSELLKLKLHLVKTLNAHKFKVDTDDILNKVNEILELVKEN